MGKTTVRTAVSLPVLLAASLTLVSCSDDVPSFNTAGLSDDQRACLMGANGMIDVAREAVADTASRPERREARRVLMEDWVARLAAGEDPCAVYGDIGRAATTF